MQRSAPRQLVPAAASWIVSLLGWWALRSARWTPGTATEGAAVALALLALTVAVVTLHGPADVARRRLRAVEQAIPLVLAPLLLLATATGGLRSPALVPAGLAALVAVRRRPPSLAVAAALGIITLVGGSGLLRGEPPTAAQWVVGAALVFALVVVPRRLLARSRALLAGERERRERLGGLLGARGHTPARLAAVDGRGRTPLERHSRRAPATGEELMTSFLRDVRDWAGAQEAVVWRLEEGGGESVTGAWSASGADAPLRAPDDATPLIAWAAREGLMQIRPEGEGAQLAVVPLRWGGGSLGALALAAPRGLTRSRAELSRWLPRQAAHVAGLAELLGEREGALRRTRHVSALLAATRDFPALEDEKLAQALFEGALTITGASRAALVEWRPAERRGSIERVSPGHPMGAALPVPERSYVGAACAEGRPVTWEDARSLDAERGVYGVGEEARRIGSLAIVPFFGPAEGNEARAVTGALVVEGDNPRDVRAEDRRALRQLTDLFSVSYHRLVDIREQRQRAITDQLTGLYNRRHFDEQLARELAKADRFGGSVALIVADVDHFKRVNDGYGHDVGDAVLRTVAGTFRQSVRDVDVPARFGGEELVVLLPHTELEGAMLTAERLRLAVESRATVAGAQRVAVTMSFGVAAYPRKGMTRESFVVAADRALYRAKREGRNCVRCASPRDYQSTT